MSSSERVKTIVNMIKPLIENMTPEEKLELKKKLEKLEKSEIESGSQQQTNHIEGVEIDGNFHFAPRQEGGKKSKPKVEIFIVIVTNTNDRLSDRLIFGRCHSQRHHENFKRRFQNLCSNLGYLYNANSTENWLGAHLPVSGVAPSFDIIEHHFPQTDWNIDFSIIQKR